MTYRSAGYLIRIEILQERTVPKTLFSFSLSVVIVKNYAVQFQKFQIDCWLCMPSQEVRGAVSCSLGIS